MKTLLKELKYYAFAACLGLFVAHTIHLLMG